MAKLIKCAGCGAEISKKAKACPHCGEPAPKETSLLTWLVLILFQHKKPCPQGKVRVHRFHRLNS